MTDRQAEIIADGIRDAGRSIKEGHLWHGFYTILALSFAYYLMFIAG